MITLPVSSRTCEAALAYAARGWHVLPLWWPDVDGRCSCGKGDCQSPGKHPIGDLVPHGLKDASTDAVTIKTWWDKYPHANVGIRTGADSGIIVLDVDGDDGQQSLRGRHLPPTPVARTGKGWHYVFAYPDSPAPNAVRVLPGVDVRGNSGFFVAPPSAHPSGSAYEWLISPEETAPSAPPEWIATLLARPREPHVADPIAEARIRQGQRNTTLTSLAGTMRRKGMTEDAIAAALLAENAARCDPPLPEDEVEGIARSVARYEPAVPPTEHKPKQVEKHQVQQPAPPPLFDDVPPWPDPVDGAGLVRSVETLFARYAVLPKGIPLVMGLWALSTWVFEAFEAHPYLTITSPEKRCGKTRLLELLHLVCRKSTPVANISEAAMFRMIEKCTPTLLIDEAQQFRTRDERSATLHDMVCAGFRRPLAVVHRIGGQNRDELKTFKVFCPKAFALIGRLTDVLADRSIEVRMRRRKPNEQIERFQFERARNTTEDLRQQLARWANDNLANVRQAYHGISAPAALEDREAELWSPLFAVVTIADPSRLPELERIAKGLSGAKANENPSVGVRLLQDIRAIFDQAEDEFLPTQDLLKSLAQIEEAPWSEWKNGRSLTAKGLADLLSRYEIEPKKARHDGQAGVRGYYRQDFQETWESYIPAQDSLNPPQAPQPLQDKGQRTIFDPPQTPPVADVEISGNASRTRPVAGVAHESVPGRGNEEIVPVQGVTRKGTPITGSDARVAEAIRRFGNPVQEVRPRIASSPTEPRTTKTSDAADLPVAEAGLRRLATRLEQAGADAGGPGR